MSTSHLIASPSIFFNHAHTFTSTLEASIASSLTQARRLKQQRSGSSNKNTKQEKNVVTPSDLTHAQQLEQQRAVWHTLLTNVDTLKQHAQAMVASLASPISDNTSNNTVASPSQRDHQPIQTHDIFLTQLERMKDASAEIKKRIEAQQQYAMTTTTMRRNTSGSNGLLNESVGSIVDSPSSTSSSSSRLGGIDENMVPSPNISILLNGISNNNNTNKQQQQKSSPSLIKKTAPSTTKTKRKSIAAPSTGSKKTLTQQQAGAVVGGAAPTSSVVKVSRISPAKLAVVLRKQSIEARKAMEKATAVAAANGTSTRSKSPAASSPLAPASTSEESKDQIEMLHESDEQSHEESIFIEQQSHQLDTSQQMEDVMEEGETSPNSASASEQQQQQQFNGGMDEMNDVTIAEQQQQSTQKILNFATTPLRTASASPLRKRKSLTASSHQQHISQQHAPVTPSVKSNSAPSSSSGAVSETPATPDFIVGTLSHATMRMLGGGGNGITTLSSSLSMMNVSSSSSSSSSAHSSSLSQSSIPRLNAFSPSTPELATVALARESIANRAARKQASSASTAATPQTARKLSTGANAMVRTPSAGPSFSSSSSGVVQSAMTPSRNLFSATTPVSTRVRANSASAIRPNMQTPSNAHPNATSEIVRIAPLQFGALLTTGQSGHSDSALDDSLIGGVSLNNSMLATPELTTRFKSTSIAWISGAQPTPSHQQQQPPTPSAPASASRSASATKGNGGGSARKAAKPKNTSAVVNATPMKDLTQTQSFTASLEAAAPSTPPTAASAANTSTSSSSSSASSTTTTAQTPAPKTPGGGGQAKKGILKTPKSSVRKSARLSKIPVPVTATANSSSDVNGAASSSTSTTAAPSTPPSSSFSSHSRSGATTPETPATPALLSSLASSSLPPSSAAKRRAASAK